jgi:IS30 family transposase
MNSYKEERRLIELASDKKKSAEEIAHLMGRPPDTIRRWAVRLGISRGKSKPKRRAAR